MTRPDDELDGCGTAGDVLGDGDVTAFVLFADVDPDDPAAVEARRAEWEQLHGA